MAEKAQKAEKPTAVYSKAAFVQDAPSQKDRLIRQVVLEEKKTYTPEQVDDLVNAWKTKEVKR